MNANLHIFGIAHAVTARRHRWALLGAMLLVCMLDACALAPNVIRPELEHMSHLTQHQPFTNEPTHYGTNMAGVTAEWKIAKHWQVEVNESIALPGDQHCANSWGEIYGPRESFSARVGYNIEVRK